jgi:uncharacterized protein
MNTTSPCNRVCRLDDEDVCVGCLRSWSEIARWSQMDDREKAAILSTLEGRRTVCQQDLATCG